MPCCRHDNVTIEESKTIAVETKYNYCVPHICCVFLQRSFGFFFNFDWREIIGFRSNTTMRERLCMGDYKLKHIIIFQYSLGTWQGDGLMNMHKNAYATQTAAIKALNARLIEAH